MKTALLLTGLSFMEKYRNRNTNQETTIDFRLYVKNIQHHIIDFFPNVDVYVATNDAIKEQVREIYQPVACHFENHGNRVYKTIKGLELIMNQTTVYDIIIVTRFDIYFQNTHFDRLRFDEFNMFSILEKPDVCDDNFYLFPHAYLVPFHTLLSQSYKDRPTNSLLMHFLLHPMKRDFKLNFIHNEYCFVHQLTSFSLRFFQECQFWLNTTLFSDNVWYHSLQHASMMRKNTNDTISFHKVVKGKSHWCWIGYRIAKKGTYHLCFDMESNQDLGDFSFLKLHHPVQFYPTPPVHAGEWTTIDVTLNVVQDNEMLCFQFDDFEGTLEITYRGITLTDSTGARI